MKNTLILIVVFAFGVFSAFGQNAEIQKAGKELEKALEKSSKVISEVAIKGCHAEIRIVTAEMDFRANQSAPPVQGMAGFPAGDYGMNNVSSDTGLIYRSKKYSIDLSQVVPGSFSASEFAHRNRKFANVAFASKPGFITLKSGKSMERVDEFRIGVRPEKLASVESAFQAMFGACVPTK
jgi:hypothetical protein